MTRNCSMMCWTASMIQNCRDEMYDGMDAGEGTEAEVAE